MALHLLKMCVGVETIQQLRDWQERRGVMTEAGYPVVTHFTRNRPQRDQELLDGGSLYWIIKGSIIVRNRIVGLEKVEKEGARKKCAIVLQAEPVETIPQRHRPIQGWRYFTSDRAPADLSSRALDKTLKVPESMAAELRSLGLI